MREFTIVLPCRDTPEERAFLHKSLPAAIALEPAEIIMALDKPIRTDFAREISSIAQHHNYSEHVELVSVERTDDWNFQLAKLLFHCYQVAKYDKIYSFDVDSIPTKNVLEGLDWIGKDGIAVYSFTKRLRLKTLADLIRYCFYRYRVMTSDYVFTGNYFISRKAFFDIVNEQEYRAIHNGVDTYLTEKANNNPKYRVVTSKKIGVIAMSEQNEDLPWRQFQLGIWMCANELKWVEVRRRNREVRRKNRVLRKNPKKLARNIISKVIHFHLWDIDEMNARQYIRIKAFVYQHPWLKRGYSWAKSNSDSETVRLAATMNEYDWSMLGVKHLPKDVPGLDLSGTGSTIMQSQ